MRELRPFLFTGLVNESVRLIKIFSSTLDTYCKSGTLVFDTPANSALAINPDIQSL